MGLRSLLEVNHDQTHRIENDPTGFTKALCDLIRTGAKHHAQALFSNYDVRLVGLRHSSEQYYIPTSVPGFPAKLTWDDFEKARADALVKAKELTGAKRKSIRDMEAMVTDLVAIIERQQEVLDDI